MSISWILASVLLATSFAADSDHAPASKAGDPDRAQQCEKLATPSARTADLRKAKLAKLRSINPWAKNGLETGATLALPVCAPQTAAKSPARAISDQKPAPQAAPERTTIIQVSTPDRVAHVNDAPSVFHKPIKEEAVGIFRMSVMGAPAELTEIEEPAAEPAMLADEGESTPEREVQPVGFARLSTAPAPSLKLTPSIERSATLSARKVAERFEQAADFFSGSSNGHFAHDLQTLLPDPEELHPAREGHFVQDFSLLETDTFSGRINDGVMDLSPDEPEPISIRDSFLGDLQSLVQQPSQVARTGVVHPMLTSSQRPFSQSSQTNQDYYLFKPQPVCTEKGSKELTGLFEPVSNITVQGNSTSPPQVDPEDANEDGAVVIVPPESLACQFLTLDAPAVYFATGYGSRRAPRNTHPFCHNPLYFEDPNLERCGQSRGCLTTASSAVHFFSTIGLTPYLIGATPPNCCLHALPDCPTCHSFDRSAYTREW